MSTIHRGLTVTVVVEEEKLEQVNVLLHDFNQHAKTYKTAYKEHLPSTYFISWLTLPAQVYAEKVKLPARILFMTSYVGSKKQHISELVNFLGPRLQAVFEISKEFSPSIANLDDLAAFIRRKTVFQAFYSGFKFIPTQDVSREQEIKSTVFDFLETQRENADFPKKSPASVKEDIENFVKNQDEFGWASAGLSDKKADKVRMLLPLGIFLLAMATSLVCLVLSFFMDYAVLSWMGLVFPAFLVILVLLFIWLRINENNPHIPNEPVSDEWIRQIIEREKNPVLNEMTVIAPLKKGLIRRIFLGLSLRLITLVGYFSYIPTVHTARWLQLDGGRRLVFIANFDNISEAYAHDFVDSDNRSRNMAVVFSHAAGFPATKWLVKRGYNHRSEYMKGVRFHQKITQFWYAFNTGLSVENLKNNRKFREGLFQKMEEEEIKEWLLTN
ncbi:peroxidase [Lunatibacter salilacus]|uniref:peroxidase n=1 Tax=Lunatibacter salilacus TaxID=2483804 RepID=UPI00131E2408|nr:peroxidase [Lunatibacter salilacus]